MNKWLNRGSPFLAILAIVVVFFAMTPTTNGAVIANQQELTARAPAFIGHSAVVQNTNFIMTINTDTDEANPLPAPKFIAAAEHYEYNILYKTDTKNCGACHRLNEIVAATNEMIPEPNLMTKTDLGVRENVCFNMTRKTDALRPETANVDTEVLRRAAHTMAMEANRAAVGYRAVECGGFIAT